MKRLLSILIAIALMLSLSVTAFAAETTYYDLWVAGVQITSSNSVIDSSDNENIEGSATFDFETNTLTLTDFKYTGAYCPWDFTDYSSVLRISDVAGAVTIVFSGENIIESTGDYGLHADVYENIKLKAADENSTVTFKCENANAFAHKPVLVGDIDIYAGSNDGDATLLAYDVFTEYPYSYKYVRFVPAEPELEAKSTTVTYEVAPTYTVTIPPTVALGETATIKAENVVVAKGKQVEVALTNANGFTVATPQGAELGYTVKNGETTVNEGDTVLTVNPDNGKTGETTLTFTTPETVKFAGDYTGTVAFTIAVKNVSNTSINFTIDGETFEAEAGMTWAEWVDSASNTIGLYVSDRVDGVYWGEGYWYCLIDATGAVKASDVIEAEAYTLIQTEC